MSEIFKLLKREDVINDDYVRLALYAVYIQSTHIDSFSEDEHDLIFERNASSIEEIAGMINEREEIDSVIVLAYTIMKVVEPKTPWEIVSIEDSIFLKNKDRYIGFGDLSIFFDTNKQLKICRIDDLISYSDIPRSINELHMRIGDVAERAREMWGIEEYIQDHDTGTYFTMYILYSVFSRIFSRYPLCSNIMMKRPLLSSDIGF